MKKISSLMLAAMAALYASGDGAQRGNGEFANRLDSMRFSDLAKFSQGQLNTFEDDLNTEKGSDPYLKGRGAYKAKIDEWANAVEDAKRGHIIKDSDAIPERVRPIDGRRVINMFEVTESQLQANPDAASRFYAELQETKKSQSYKDQPRTKAQADKWINWLKDNGFGPSEDKVSGSAGSNPPPAYKYVNVDNGSKQREDNAHRLADDYIRQQEIILEQQRAAVAAAESEVSARRYVPSVKPQYRYN